MAGTLEELGLSPAGSAPDPEHTRSHRTDGSGEPRRRNLSFLGSFLVLSPLYGAVHWSPRVAW